MKKCSNPNCDSAFLYGEDKTVCPFCHSILIHNDENNTIHLRPADRLADMEIVHDQTTQFIQEHFGTMECHGRIIEIDHQELFNSNRLKLMNTIFRGEPYQFAHQTIEYTIRVESLGDDYPGDVTDFCMYGSYLGRMQVGDEVLIKAKNLKNRRVVKSIYNQTTDTLIKPGFQIPALWVRIMIGIIMLMMIAIMFSIVELFKSGVVSAFLIALLTSLIPIFIVLWIFYSMIKRIFGR